MRAFHSCFAIVTVGVSALFFCTSPAVAQKAEPRVQDEAAIRQASKLYLAAIQKNDHKAMAEFWLPDGVYVDENGRSFKAQDSIAAAADARSDAEPPSKASISTIRFLTADAAVEEGTSEFAESGKPPIKGKFSAVWVRRNDQWKLDSLREYRDSPNASGPNPLAALDPFVGEWTGQMGGSTVHVSAQWNPAKTFLRRDITITTDGKMGVSASQQVGWDPVRHQLRSWVFSEDGGYGQGWWTLEGTLWMVAAQGVQPDGRVNKATHVFKFADRNTILWKSLDATVDNQPQRDSEVTLKRDNAKTSAATPETKPAPATQVAQVPAPAAKAAAPAKAPVAAKAPPAAKGAPKTAAAPKATAKEPKAVESKAAAADAERKSALLKSEAWKRVEHEFNEWVSVQVVYTPQQMEANKAKLRSEISKMNAEELQKFIGDLDAKLKTLLSKDAMEARAWLGQYLSVYTEGYRKKFIGDLPDFADMTSTQMEQEYLKLKAKAMAQQRQQAAFDNTRSLMADQAVAQNKAAAAAAQRASYQADVGNYTNTYQSQYHPPSDMHKEAPQQQFWVGPWGGISYALPGSSF